MFDESLERLRKATYDEEYRRGWENETSIVNRKDLAELLRSFDYVDNLARSLYDKEIEREYKTKKEKEMNNKKQQKINKSRMSLVYRIASDSEDNRTKIGAIVVNDRNRILSTGYNGLPGGCVLLPKRMERPEKYHWFEHAERNAIFNAANIGVSLNDGIMYTQGIPCSDCARGVIQVGIKKVIVHALWEKEGKFNENQKWVDSAERSKQMFREAGVELEYYDGELETEIEGLTDGRVIKLK